MRHTTQSCVVREYESYEAAEAAALTDATACNGDVFSGMLSKQGSRQMLNTTVTFSDIASKVRTKTPLTAEELADSENRPQIDKHVSDIVAYLGERLTNATNYILPPVVLGIRESVRVHTVANGESPVRVAFLVLPHGVEMQARDGYHRTTAVKEVVATIPSSALETVGAVVFFDLTLVAVHRDLVDIAQARPMARAVFNTWRGAPIDVFTSQLMTENAFLAAMVEPMQDQLSPSSTKLITRSMLQNGMQDLAHRRGREDNKFSEGAFDAIVGDEGGERWVELKGVVTAFVEMFSRLNPQWNDLRQHPDGGKARAYREAYLHCRNLGWRALCQAVCAIVDQRPEEFETLVSKLATLDFRVANPLWSKLGFVTPDPNLKTSVMRYRVESNNPMIELMSRYLISEVLQLDVARPKLPLRLDRRPCGTRTTRNSQLRKAVSEVDPTALAEEGLVAR